MTFDFPARLWALMLGTVLVCTPAGADETGPYKFDAQGRILMPIELANGDSADFLLDTSARRTSFVNRLVENTGAKTYVRKSIRHFSAAGALSLPLARVPELSLYGRKVEDNIVALFSDKSSANGLIGFDMVRGYILHLEPESQTAHLMTHPGALADQNWRVLPGKPNRHLGIVLQAEIAGLPFEILLATGSSHSYISRKSAIALKEGMEMADYRRSFEIFNGLMPFPKVRQSFKLPAFDIEGWPVGPMTVGIQPIDKEDATGSKGGHVLILGADFLANRELAFDYRNFGLWVPPESTS